MKKTATQIHETKELYKRIISNKIKIKGLQDSLNLSWTNFKEFEKRLTETKEKRKSLQDQIKALEKENEIYILACNYKANDIKNNLYINSLKALKDLKLLEKNLTDLRKEKIKNHLIESKCINENNLISIYRDYTDYINIRVLEKNVNYNEGIEIYFSDTRYEYIEKMELKEIKTDDFYLKLATDFINKIDEIKKEVENMNNSIKNKLNELESLNNNYYDTRYIYKDASIDLYK